MEKFSKYWLALPTVERESLARKCGTSANYLRNIAYGTRNASPKLAAIIERETGGRVSRKDFYPGDWAIIWPELR